MKSALSRVRRALLVADDAERLAPLRAACKACADEVAVVEVDDDATAVVLARAQLFDVVLAHAASRRVDLPALLGALAAEGGGEGRTSGGGHPVTPWGQLTKGKKTRSDRKPSGRFIVERRKK